MAKKKAPAAPAAAKHTDPDVASQETSEPPKKAKRPAEWTDEFLLSHKHLGPGILGDEMFAAVQEAVERTNGGVLGPAIVGEPPAAKKGKE